MGLGLSTPLGDRLTLELGVDATRQSNVLGSGPGHRYATAYAGLGIAFDASAVDMNGAPAGRDPHATPGTHDADSGHATAHGGFVVPAGLFVPHGPARAGRWMFGLRVVSERSGGALRQGRTPVDDTVLAQACGTAPCVTAPTAMRMGMHMLDIGYALTDRINLMVMPQFMQMRMDSRLLASNTPVDPGVHFGSHESGAWGDTPLLATLALHESAGARCLLSLGLSLPTGRFDLAHRRSHQRDRGAMDHAMQTGSGTWDLLPSVAWLQQSGAWSGGVQLSATRRIGRNDAGYALGHRWQAAGWAGYRWAGPFTATLRLSRSVDGAIHGERTDLHASGSPADEATNHGGRLDEVGLGLVVDRLPGAYAGMKLSVEWLQPLRHALRGVQLPRRGGLALSWSHHF